MVIISEWISGCMLGIEFPKKMVVFDLLILRIIFVWGLTEEEKKDLGVD